MELYDDDYFAELLGMRLAVTESLELLKSLIAHYYEATSFAPRAAAMTPSEEKEFYELVNAFNEKRREETLAEIYKTAKEFISAYEALKANA